MSLASSSRPFKAGDVDVTRGVDLGTLASAAIASCCDQIRQNTPGARESQDPGFTHQLRVGLRRLRVALKLFQQLIDPTQRGALESDLRWAFSQLGAQRELDVLLRGVVDPLFELDDTPMLSDLKQAIEAARAERREQVRATLSSERYEGMLRALDALQESLRSPWGPAAKPARRWMRKKLERRRARALALSEAALAGDAHQRHELRKEFKKLRYASELGSGLFKRKRVKRFLGVLSELQDVLGALNDVAAGRAELAVVASGRESELAPALEAAQTRLGVREAEELAALAPAMHALAQARPFWRPRA
jgi:triphosphatase